MKIKTLLAAALAALTLGGCQSDSTRPVTLTLKPYAGTSLRTVDVTIGGRTSPFIFDTGGGNLFINPDQVANAGCKPFGKATGFRADGQPISVPRCGPIAVQIGGFHAKTEVNVFDLSALLGKKAPPVGGLLGMTPFRDQAITLDMAHDRVIVETPKSLHRRIRDMHPIRARIARGPGGDVEPFIQVRAKSGTLWMEVDSGNNGPVFLSSTAADQLGIKLNKGERRKLDLDVVGLGKVPVTVVRRDMIYDGQLNPAFLKKMTITFDFASGRAWARMNSRHPG